MCLGSVTVVIILFAKRNKFKDNALTFEKIVNMEIVTNLEA